MKKILILGGKGPAVVIADAISHANSIGYNEYTCAGLLNDNEKEIDGYKVIGKFSDIPRLAEEGYYFINTVYKMGVQEERAKKFNSLGIPDEKLAVFVHPMAYVAPTAKLGPGCVVMAGSSISSMTKIGKCTLIMNNASVGHDTVIGDFNFITSNACVASYIVTGYSVWFGVNCTVRGKLKIGNRASVGIGAVVTKDIPDDEIWVGNPAKLHKTNEDKITL
ncbi:MAG: NeuD/PglB/VioB family sugar acetyltransferase [Spirochaetes bacterium]|nr:NeuD/PglB/VioB family sugar acetyltransferase [Spirochaetota bacterium]